MRYRDENNLVILPYLGDRRFTLPVSAHHHASPVWL